MAQFNQNFNLKIHHKTAKIEVSNLDLMYLTIKEGILDMLSYVELKLADSGNFSESFPIVDGDVITIMIAPTKESDGFTMDFTVSDFSITPKFESRSGEILITGYMKAEKISIVENRVIKGTSLSVLETVCKEMGLNFKNLNNVSTADTMRWIQYGNKYDFLNHVLSRSYVPNDVCFLYGDHNNNINIASYKKAADANTKFDAVYDQGKSQQEMLTPDDKNIMYYMNFDVVCLRGQNVRESGYGIKSMFYNATGSLTKKTLTDVYKNTDLNNRLRSAENKQSKYSISPSIQSNPNVYLEYAYAMEWNKMMRMNLFENTISLTVNPITDVSLMDTINLKVPSFVESRGAVNDVWSGKYLVVGITHTVSQGGKYSKVVLIARAGMNKSMDRKVYDVQ